MIPRPQLSQKARYNGVGGVCETQLQMVDGLMNPNGDVGDKSTRMRFHVN